MAKVVFSKFHGSRTERKKIDAVLREQNDERFYIVSGNADGDGLNISRGSLSAYDEKSKSRGAEYYATIKASNNGYELSENDIRNDDAKNGAQQNIFGYFPSTVDALRDLMANGNTTADGRKPVLVFIRL